MVFVQLAVARFAILHLCLFCKNNSILSVFILCEQIEEGKTNTKLAVHGLGEPQIDAGFVCTCQTYVTGPGVVIRLDQADEVYETQYGQFEKSYGELKFAKKN